MKTKFVLVLFCVTISIAAYSQDQFFTKTGVISFKAGTSVEDVDGVNKSVSSVIDIKTGKIEMAMLIKGFEFKRGLMQEHFNENYMESDKYPKSTFKGKIDMIPGIDLTINGTYQVTASGILEIHGIKKEVSIQGTMKSANNTIVVDTDFEIALEDFKIEIPSAVKDKIAKKATAHFEGQYKVLRKVN